MSAIISTTTVTTTSATTTPTAPKAWTPEAFLKDIVDPAIAALPLDVDNGETIPGLRLMLFGTALQESLLTHVEQLPNKDGSRGPALGYFQMEPATHKDIWANYLAYRKAVASQLLALAELKSGVPKAEILKTNHVYAAAMARVHYRRAPGKMPGGVDVKAAAAYWKQYYNTPLGKGKASEFEDKLAKLTIKF